MNQGVIFIAYGLNAQREATAAIKSLRQHHPDWPISVIGDRVLDAAVIDFDDRNSLGRYAKTNLDRITPYDLTLYLDADTRILGNVSGGFSILRDGWDLAIAYSEQQGSDVLWHVSAEERSATIGELGLTPLQLQGGVRWFARNGRVAAFFHAWRNEWERWRGQDQGALLRALWRAPVRLWLLGRAWNNGDLIKHRYGAARRRR